VTFKRLVEWTAQQVNAGRKVHCGCIGGHGRTGLFLAALKAYMDPEEKDPITLVRTAYCKKAVESTVQVKFLAEHFGAKEVAGAKLYAPSSPKASAAKQSTGTASVASGYHTGGRRSTGAPQHAERSIWGA
jgi:hypothetical protein